MKKRFTVLDYKRIFSFLILRITVTGSVTMA